MTANHKYAFFAPLICAALVLAGCAPGASNEDIAENLVIAPTTAKKHVSNILQKLDVENRTQAVARGRSLGLCQ